MDKGANCEEPKQNVKLYIPGTDGGEYIEALCEAAKRELVMISKEKEPPTYDVRDILPTETGDYLYDLIVATRRELDDLKAAGKIEDDPEYDELISYFEELQRSRWFPATEWYQ